MKKKLIISFIVVLSFFAIAVILLLTNINYIIETNRTKIEDLISKSIDTPVKLGALKASFIPLGIKATDIKVGNEKENSGINSFFISLRLLPLLTKTADITNLEIIEPKITLIKNKNGVFLEGFPKRSKDVNKPNNVTAKQDKITKDQNQTSDASIPLDIKLNSISVKNGIFSFKNKINQSDINIEKINFLSSIILENSVAKLPSGKFSAEINSANLDLNYTDTSYDLKSQQTEFQSLVITTPAGIIETKGNINKNSEGDILIQKLEFDLKKLFKLLTIFSPSIPLSEINGSLNSELDIHLTGKGFPEIDGTLNLQKAEALLNNLKIDNLATKILLKSTPLQTAFLDPLSFELNKEKISGKLKASIVKQSIEIDDLSLNLFKGILKLLADFEFNTKKFNSKVALENIDISSALKVFAPKLADTISGTLSSMIANIKGAAKQDLIKNLSGNVSLKLKNGELKHFNILKDIFKVASPLLIKEKSSEIPEQIKEKLERNGTIFDDITVDLNIKGYTVKINKFSLENDLFTIEGKGNYRIKEEFEINTDITFNQTISKELAERIKELRPALTQNNNLVFPLKITGSNNGISVKPDVPSIVKETVKEKVKEKAEKGLEKLFKKLAKKEDKESQEGKENSIKQ